MMKKVTKILIASLALLGTALQSADVQHYIASALIPLVHNHPNLSAIVAAVTAILALVHDPKSSS